MDIYGFAQQGLHFELGGFGILYAVIALIMWLCTFLFSFEYLKKNKAHGGNSKSLKTYYISFFVTFFSTVGVFLSKDLYTLFIFFEIMSLTSYVWVAFEGDKDALKAASTYLAIAIFGGLIMLMGIFLLYNLTGTLDIEKIHEYSAELFSYINNRVVSPDSPFASERNKEYRDLFIAGLCLLIGFGAKAGAFPLHIWLPKSHPVAPAPLSALLSGILTKAGVFGILLLSCKILMNDETFGSIILTSGVITMLLGAVLAIFSINIKRVLACSSVSQIGFILVGTGIYMLLKGDGNLAISGALLHMVNHSVFKLVLFMAAGAVFMNCHSLNLNKIRGFGRNKKILKAAFCFASLGIMCIPLFSGYISKTLIHEAILEYHEAIISGRVFPSIFGANSILFFEKLFLICGGCTIAYMLKLFIAVFIEKNSDEKLNEEYDAMAGSYMTPLSKAVIFIPSLAVLLFGMFPGYIMDNIALSCKKLLYTEKLNIPYFSVKNLSGSLTSLIIGIFLYIVLIRGVLMRREGFESPFKYIKKEGLKGFIKKELSGASSYVDLWPEWLDLEEIVYKPLFFKILPAIFGFICRILDSLVDSIIVSIRRIILSDSEIPHELPEGTPFTHALGRLSDAFEYIMNHTIWRKHPRRYVDHAHLYAMKHEALKETEFIILRSMSFSLILFCLGLMVTIIYLLYR